MSRKAIGSVLPRPEPELPAGDPRSIWAAWTTGRRHVSTFRTARGALAALLVQRGVRRLWMPAYACDTLAAGAAGVEVAWYGVDDDLAPKSFAPAAGDAVLAIDYFGAPPPTGFREQARSRPDVLWIEDRAQALEPGEAWGDVLLYSPRKLIGVADGGLLVSDDPLPQPGAARDEPPGAAQAARAADPEGRDPDAWFPLFQAQEAAFAVDDQPMSAGARASLETAALDWRAQRRRENWDVLARWLAHLALWPGRVADFAPLAFPVRLNERDAVAAALGREGIWCAKHWAGLPSPPAFFEAHLVADQLLSLPCDERYDAADMERVAGAVLTLAR